MSLSTSNVRVSRETHLERQLLTKYKVYGTFTTNQIHTSMFRTPMLLPFLRNITNAKPAKVESRGFLWICTDLMMLHGIDTSDNVALHILLDLPRWIEPLDTYATYSYSLKHSCFEKR